MASTIVVTAEFTPAPGRLLDLKDALVAAIPAVHAEEGCLLYAIHDAPDGRIVMIEKWASVELLDQHAGGEAVASLDASIEGLIAVPVRVERMTAIAAGTSAQGRL
ncbi:hypothetical protein ART_3361 [Arthrobacter sp. PAMC 25486]|uniref:putative quinol monooxygenase n=1 Tax=Arthrobacter sp. PAMC 25486 TaxID=1494608 RepID=UPI0005361B51|nr:putative quinol monooxygenase [Arthrobacter sp. PAMC 25486]AIY02960.1 hypothetical protein ART_3361 [Arthrobacter sp. PAMC 25486]